MSALNIGGFCSVFSMLQGYLPFVFRPNEPANGPAPEPIDEGISTGNEFEATDQPITSEISPVDHSDMQAAASETEEDNSSGSASATSILKASQEPILNTTDQCIRTSYRDNSDQETADPCIDIGRRQHNTYVFNGAQTDYYMVKISLNDLEAEWLTLMPHQDDSEYFVDPPATQEIELYAEVDVIRFTLNRIEWLDDPLDADAHSSDDEIVLV